MRYPASEKLEIIRLVEKSHLPVRRTLDKLGIARATFYRWYDLYRLGGIDEGDKPLRPVKRTAAFARDLLGAKVQGRQVTCCQSLLPE